MAARKPAKTVAFNNKYYVIVIRVILLVASDFSRPLLLTLNFFSFASFLEAASSSQKSATISVQTLIARKTAMSFWDSVTTGAQNAAETTKLVSIVRLFCSLFCSFAVSLSCASFAGRNQNATKAKQNSDTRWGDGLERLSPTRGPRAFKVFLLKSSLH